LRIVCVASSAIGHIDFGGGGFLRLANALREVGCDVRWLSYGEQVERLKTKAGNGQAAPEIAHLALRPFFRADEIARFETAHRRRVEAMQRFRRRLREVKPDLILFDRLLAYGGLVAEQDSTPYAAIGTPGGAWGFEEAGAAVNVHPAPGPVDAYLAYGDALKDDLGWRNGAAGSAWLRSPYFNICFMPRTFYAGVEETAAAHVHHHGIAPAPRGQRRMAVSFGNQGAHDRLWAFLRRAVDERLAPFPIDAYAGADDQLKDQLQAAFSADDVNIHGWVDFAHHLNNVGCMAFLGGVGTIWRCLNNRIPMIIIPGLIGDQLENARRVAELGIGYRLGADDDPRQAVEACFNGPALTARIDGLRSIDAYSETLESMSHRIRALAAG